MILHLFRHLLNDNGSSGFVYWRQCQCIAHCTPAVIVQTNLSSLPYHAICVFTKSSTAEQSRNEKSLQPTTQWRTIALDFVPKLSIKVNLIIFCGYLRIHWQWETIGHQIRRTAPNPIHLTCIRLSGSLKVSHILIKANCKQYTIGYQEFISSV